MTGEAYSSALRALVRQQMALRKLDQRSLSALAGVHESIISRWLSGATMPRESVIDAVAAELGIRPAAQSRRSTRKRK